MNLQLSTINLFDRVLSFESVNEDGKQIIQNLNLKNKKITGFGRDFEKIDEGYIKSEMPGCNLNNRLAKAEVLVNEILERQKIPCR